MKRIDKPYSDRTLVPFIVIWASLLLGIALYLYGSRAVGQIYQTMLNTQWGKTHFVIAPDGTPVTPQIPTAPGASGIIDAPETTASLLEKLCEKKGYLVLFSPDDNVHETLLYLIEQEQEAIQIAIFNFTDMVIANALAAAVARGITVSVITDRGCLLERYSKIDDLYKAGAQIFAYNPNWGNKKRPGIMHHKFIIFSKNIDNRPLVWTGSYNFTKSAHYYNQENVIVMNRSGAVRKFKNQFERMRTKSDIYRPLFTPVS